MKNKRQTQQAPRKQKARRPSGNRPLWYALLFLNDEQAKVSDQFLSDFGYQKIEEREWPGKLVARDLSSKVREETVIAVLSADVIDAELLSEEWSSFSRVGTPGEMILVGLRKKAGTLTALSERSLQ